MNFKWWPVRRLTQVAVIGAIASPLAGLTFFRGNLAAAELFGVPLADPLAFFQATLASRLFVPGFLGAAAIVAIVYAITGGRTFCGWVCPVHLATELGDRLRTRMGTGNLTLPVAGIRWSLAATLAVSVVAAVPLFEILSPIGITTRAVMFRSTVPLLILAAILVVEILVAGRIWCRSLCPAGGFYSLLGRVSPVRIGLSRERCTNCGECSRVCMVPEVLEPPLEGKHPQVISGDCTRCADCIDICPTRALYFEARHR